MSVGMHANCETLMHKLARVLVVGLNCQYLEDSDVESSGSCSTGPLSMKALRLQ